ncbi:4-aminobutyrate transaminase [Ascosphaera atra]|nr:4-aminobutyrate transaminase [Ascosphaera atra]
MAFALRNGGRRVTQRVQLTRAFATTRTLGADAPFFPNEPSGPSVKTAIPGPKGKAAAERLNKIFDTRSLNIMGDYNASVGN